MSKFNVGDKVYAEVVIIAKNNEVYDINADGNTKNPYVHFVIPEKYLHKIPKKTYEDGLNDAWKLAREIYKMDGPTMKSVFGSWEGWDAYGLSFHEAMDKVRKWNDSKEIHVGDIVTDSYGNKDVVTGVGGQKETDTVCILRTDGFATTVYKREVTKTGRTIDIESLLKQIGGME